MKKTTRTTEEITREIIEYFKNNEDVLNDCMEELDSYNGYLGDNHYYLMDELDELHNGIEPSEILRKAFFGYDEDTWTTDKNGEKSYCSFNPNKEYFRYNAYGNLISAEYKDYTEMLEPFTIEVMKENRNYIDTIDYNEDLRALFDELEEAEEK